MFLPPILFALALFVLPGAADEARPFRLEPGDYRYIHVSVKQVPSEVDCRYRVIAGDPSVHVELLPLSEFRLFSRGREHDTLATTAPAASGAFRRMVEDVGDYAVVISNAKQSPAAMVTLDVSVDAAPDAAVSAHELSPRRRMAVIVISFSVFFALASFSAWRLLRAIKETHS